MIDLNNPWIIGTIPAVASGLAVNALSRLVWSNKDKREAKRKIKAANQEIIASLRVSLAEDMLLSPKILNALIRATAYKYDLDKQFMMSSELCSDTLIKEVLDSSFLSQSQKAEYSQRIIRQLVSEERKTTHHYVTEVKLLDTYDDEYNKVKRQNYVSAISGLVSVVVLLVASIGTTPEPQRELLLRFIEALGPPMVSVVALLTVSIYIKRWIDAKFDK